MMDYGDSVHTKTSESYIVPKESPMMQEDTGLNLMFNLFKFDPASAAIIPIDYEGYFNLHLHKTEWFFNKDGIPEFKFTKMKVHKCNEADKKMFHGKKKNGFFSTDSELFYQMNCLDDPS